MHFWSCDITKHEIYKFKDKDFWFGLKNYLKLFHHVWSHQVHFWLHDWAKWASAFFLKKNANTFETVSVRHYSYSYS